MAKRAQGRGPDPAQRTGVEHQVVSAPQQRHITIRAGAGWGQNASPHCPHSCTEVELLLLESSGGAEILLKIGLFVQFGVRLQSRKSVCAAAAKSHAWEQLFLGSRAGNSPLSLWRKQQQAVGSAAAFFLGGERC